MGAASSGSSQVPLSDLRIMLTVRPASFGPAQHSRMMSGRLPADARPVAVPESIQIRR